MKRVESIIRLEKLHTMKVILSELGVTGATFSPVFGYSRQEKNQYLFNGEEQYEQLFSSISVQAVVEDDLVEPMIEMVTTRIASGNVGDGKIFVSNVEEAVRVRTGERGVTAL